MIAMPIPASAQNSSSMATTIGRPVGSFIVASVFRTEWLGPLAPAKGHPFYLLHSPEDQVCLYEFAELAADKLGAAGAKVTLENYSGGHGWRGDVYGNMRKGFDWLLAK